VFSSLLENIGNRIRTYKSYPRLVGETGGKDYIFMHHSADMDRIVVASVRGAFEYRGQKYSVCSRMYVPKLASNEVKEKLILAVSQIKISIVLEFKNFHNAVIDEKAFDTVTGYIDRFRRSNSAKIIAGGNADKSKGYYVESTIILTTDS
jgi:1-pyrroline-5-carboxylate dehydrogenase